ncbi:hypothetical protein IJI99_01275 [bacterium]|nr:hypothetical protein [bacterium]
MYTYNYNEIMANDRKAAMDRMQVMQGRRESESPKIVANPLADIQIKALGRWNEQMADRVITRQNGYASYSLLKSIMNRNIMGCD